MKDSGSSIVLPLAFVMSALGMLTGGYALYRVMNQPAPIAAAPIAPANSSIASSTPAPPQPTTSSSTASPIAVSSADSVSFSDISGAAGEKEIQTLARLGVFDSTSGNFNPQQPITRAEFIRWLFKANNAIFANDATKQVRPAQWTQATFPDVPPTHPDFQYIQGMINAGFAVGFNERDFRPDEPLTREQMIAIKSGLDLGGVEDSSEGLRAYVPTWSDRDQISRRFHDSFNSEYMYNLNAKNVERTFGAIKTFNPQAPVTRAEAAVCISVLGTHDKFAQVRSAEQAL